MNTKIYVKGVQPIDILSKFLNLFYSRVNKRLFSIIFFGYYEFLVIFTLTQLT